MKTQEKLPLDIPASNEEAIYHIVIRGQVTDSLIHIADSLQVRRVAEEDVITLIGWLPDQSSLLGLLNGLNSIRREIISVRLISMTNKNNQPFEL